MSKEDKTFRYNERKKWEKIVIINKIELIMKCFYELILYMQEGDFNYAVDCTYKT